MRLDCQALKAMCGLCLLFMSGHSFSNERYNNLDSETESEAKEIEHLEVNKASFDDGCLTDLSPTYSIDLDGNAQYDALTDGLLLLRGMFGLTGDSLISGAIATNAIYTTSAEIEERISKLGAFTDIDNNGSVDALTDGLIVLRYLFGLRGDSLINGVLASNATRQESSQIETHIQSIMPKTARIGVPEAIALPIKGKVRSVAFNSNNPDVILAATEPSVIGESGTGIFRSEDRGKQWILVEESYAPYWMKFFSNDLVLTNSSNNFGDNLDSYGKSSDCGSTFEFIGINAHFFLGGFLYADSLSVDPMNHAEWWFPAINAIGGGFYRTIDSGDTWNMVKERPDGFIKAVVHATADPDDIYLISDISSWADPVASLLKSTNNGQTFQPITNGLSVYDLPTELITANKTVIINNNYSLDAGDTWIRQEQLLAYNTIIFDSVWYRLDRYGAVEKSQNYGDLWETITDPLPSSFTWGSVTNFDKIGTDFFIAYGDADYSWSEIEAFYVTPR